MIYIVLENNSLKGKYKNSILDPVKLADGRYILDLCVCEDPDFLEIRDELISFPRLNIDDNEFEIVEP